MSSFKDFGRGTNIWLPVQPATGFGNNNYYNPSLGCFSRSASNGVGENTEEEPMDFEVYGDTVHKETNDMEPMEIEYYPPPRILEQASNPTANHLPDLRQKLSKQKQMVQSQNKKLEPASLAKGDSWSIYGAWKDKLQNAQPDYLAEFLAPVTDTVSNNSKFNGDSNISSSSIARVPSIKFIYEH